MKIGEAAAASGCHIETIRYYERIGLLKAPKRTSGGYRSYTVDDVEKLRFVSRGRDLGFSLDDIRSLLTLAAEPGGECADVDRIARAHLRDIENRVDQLNRMAEELKKVIDSCQGRSHRTCLILGSLKGTRSKRTASPAAS